MKLGTRLLWSVVAASFALLLALAAAHLYQPPNLLGSSDESWWLESDFLCSLGSSVLALALGWWAGRQTAQSRAFRSLVARALIWFGLTALLFAVWGQVVSLLTLLIAPTHAFACLRLATLWRNWRSDVRWRRVS